MTRRGRALAGGGGGVGRRRFARPDASSGGLGRRRAACAKPAALIVDHALRDGSAGEARKAAAAAKKAGLAAHILTRKGATPKSGIEALARDARYGLMGSWLKRRGIVHSLCGPYPGRPGRDIPVAPGPGQRTGRAFGHAGAGAFSRAGFRGSDSGAAAVAHRPRPSCAPISGHRRQDWLEDPMNSEARFARSRIRALMPAAGSGGAFVHPHRRRGGTSRPRARARWNWRPKPCWPGRRGPTASA